MSDVIVIGAQWGDEGKGKIVDWLSERADIVVRFQGGHNAGHTLVIDGVTHKLSLLPSGILRKGKLSVIGNGVVVDIRALLEEIERIRLAGVEISPVNLLIAENAHIILPLHCVIDKLREEALGKGKIGTTGRGIGPAYEDKVARRGIRMSDLQHPEFLAARVANLVEYYNLYLKGAGAEILSASAILDELLGFAEILNPYIQPVWKMLDEAHRAGKRTLFEGAQGILLDVDHGTYPFVTSSNTLSSSAITGAGAGFASNAFVLGIVKAYTTRVGSGPFPTELDDDIGEALGKRGHEFGTVTSRKRRCGWLDASLVRQTCRITGIDGIAFTKLDVLDGFDEIKVAVGYDIDGKHYDYLPNHVELQNRAVPVYETVKGWGESTAGLKEFSDLPAGAKDYIRMVEELVGTPISLVSTGAERNDTILIKDPFV